MAAHPPVVSIASSRDASLGPLAAPLDASIDGAAVDAVLRLALARDRSPRSLERIVKDGERVVIKPNIVTSRSHRASSYWHDGIPYPGQVTDLRVMRSLVLFLAERTRAGRITIAEGPAEWATIGSRRADPSQTEDGWTVSWPEFEGLSYAGIAAEANRIRPGLVDLVDLNEDRLVEIAVPDPGHSGIGALFRIGQEERDVERFGRGALVPGTGTLLERHLVPETLVRADRFINVAAMKTHGITGVSIGLKNYVGIRPAREDLGISKGDTHKGSLDAALVDLLCLRPADYSIVEGFHATEGNGPQWGTDIHHNVVVASADPVAADTVAASIMGFVPSDIEYLLLASRKLLGTCDLANMTLVGDGIEEVRRRFARALGRKGIGLLARGNRRWEVVSPEAARPEVYESQERYIDLDRCFPGRRPARATATATAVSEMEQRAMLWASADGRMEIKLNGRKVLDRPSLAPHCIGELRVPVSLRAGENELEVTVEPGEGFGFTALLCDEHGESLPGVEYRIADP